MPPILAVRDLVVQHPDGGFAVKLPGLTIRPGDVVALTGSSGCGKSTLLRGLLGVGRGRCEGEVEAGGEVLVPGSAGHRRWLRQDVAFLLQDATAALDPFVPVGEQIAAASGVDSVTVLEALTQLGVAPDRAATLALQRPHELSGGEAQRCQFAVALLRRPQLIVCDEPTAGLDDENRGRIVEHLQGLMTDGAALLVATHDDALVRGLGARTWRAQAGEFRECTGLAPRAPDAGAGSGELTGEGGVVLRALGVTVGAGATVCLRDVDLEVRRREIVALVGESGVGKTTLARVLCGHLRPLAGEVQRPSRSSSVQMLFQDAHGSLTPGRRIRQLVDETRAPGFDVIAVAKQLGLDVDVLSRSVEELSGGERRRAALLRALSVQPEVLVCDEPLESLDRESAQRVSDLLAEIHRRRGVALVIVTHDLEWARSFAHRVLTVAEGSLGVEEVANGEKARAAGSSGDEDPQDREVEQGEES